MYNIWSNSYSNKTYDLTYINNNLNYDFLSKYALSELWLKKLNNYIYFNYFFVNVSLIYASKFYYILNSAFNSFLKYNKTVKLIADINPIFKDINIFNTIQLNCIIKYNYKFLFCSAALNINFFNNSSAAKFNLLDFLNLVYSFSVTICNLIWLSSPQNNSFIESCNNYFEFFTNYMNFLNEKNKPARYLQSLILNIPGNSFAVHNSYNINYYVKNISNLFAYSWVKYITGYYICITGVIVISLVFIFNTYRINIWWYFGVLNFIKILYILFFINNILRVSKKLWILLYIFFFAYITNLFLYSEINIEYISIISISVISISVSIITYFLYKYNIYFFSFLELSIIVGKSLVYIFKQYFRDLLNILAYLLRLFLLFIRLNIYDGLDDFFDSYYIFIGDFDTYDYLEIIYAYGYNFLPSIYDNLYDKSILNYEELEFYLNLFYLYAALLFKFLIFLILLLEGGFRLLLASYIFILVILEINNFNVIFIEQKN